MVLETSINDGEFQKIMRILALCLLSLAFTACSQSPQNHLTNAPTIGIVGTWESPDLNSIQGYRELILKNDGTGIATSNLEQEKQIVMTSTNPGGFKDVVEPRSLPVVWHISGEHLFINVKGQATGTELSYEINGDEMTYGVPGVPTKYILERKKG